MRSPCLQHCLILCLLIAVWPGGAGATEPEPDSTQQTKHALQADKTAATETLETQEPETQPEYILDCESLTAALADLRAKSTSHALLADTLTEDQYLRCGSQRIWQLRNPRDTEANTDDDFDWSLLDGRWGLNAAVVFETLLWVCAGIVVFLALLLLARHRGLLGKGASKSAAEGRAPLRIGDLELDPASLPDDPVAAARAAFARGQTRLAMSLLYRLAIIRLADRGVRFADASTEQECLQSATRDLQDRQTTDGFAPLTQRWVHMAYAHRAPQADAFEADCQWVQSLQNTRLEARR